MADIDYVELLNANRDVFESLGIKAPLNATERFPAFSAKYTKPVMDQIRHLAGQKFLLSELAGQYSVSLLDIAERRLFSVRGNHAILNESVEEEPNPIIRADVSSLEQGALRQLKGENASTVTLIQIETVLQIFELTKRFKAIPFDTRPALVQYNEALGEMSEAERGVFHGRQLTIPPVPIKQLGEKYSLNSSAVVAAERTALRQLEARLGSKTLKMMLSAPQRSSPLRPEET
jgi:hypothetical protein